MRTRRVVWLVPGAVTPTYRRVPFSAGGTSTAKNESAALMPGGGNCRTPRSNSAAICSSARRMVAVEAMTFGLLPCRAAQQVDRGLVEPGERAERPGDQVQLVLDDQLRRADAGEGRR